MNNFMQKYQINIKKYMSGELNLVDFLALMNNDLAYYSQPFRPEMVTELYERWVEPKASEPVPSGKVYDYISSDLNIILRILNNIKNEPIWLRIFSGVNYTFPFPRNLDEFITACQVSGIELIPKGEK